MFANRFTAVLDACALVSPLKRNLLLSLAEADFFRPRWSSAILAETEAAIFKLCEPRDGADGARVIAKRAIDKMNTAFQDSTVEGYESLMTALGSLPDEGDRHVLAAAIRTNASVVVTENVKDFPEDLLAPYAIEAKTADEFIADTIDLNTAIAIPAIRRMRARLKNPALTPELLLLRMEQAGLTATADALKEHLQSI